MPMIEQHLKTESVTIYSASMIVRQGRSIELLHFVSHTPLTKAILERTFEEYRRTHNEYSLELVTIQIGDPMTVFGSNLTVFRGEQTLVKRS